MMSAKTVQDIAAGANDLAATLVAFSDRQGVTDITLASNGTVAVRMNTFLQGAQLPWLPANWAGVARALLGSPPWDSPRGEMKPLIKVIPLGDRRFRCTWSRNASGETISVRPLPKKIMTPEDLNLLPILSQTAAHARGGLIIFCGPTGSGKTTSQASLIEHRAKCVGGKFITLESPIEYQHFSTSKAFFSQLEVGVHVESYKAGLEQALVENPNVICVQELRDPAAVEIALAAALSGHLVFATLHANDAATVPDRIASILGASPEMRTSVYSTIAMCLELIVGIRLIPGIGGGLLPIFDVITMREHASDTERLPKMIKLVEQGKYQDLRSEQMLGSSCGMTTFDASYSDLVSRGLVAL